MCNLQFFHIICQFMSPWKLVSFIDFWRLKQSLRLKVYTCFRCFSFLLSRKLGFVTFFIGIFIHSYFWYPRFPEKRSSWLTKLSSLLFYHQKQLNLQNFLIRLHSWKKVHFHKFHPRKLSWHLRRSFAFYNFKGSLGQYEANKFFIYNPNL